TVLSPAADTSRKSPERDRPPVVPPPAPTVANTGTLGSDLDVRIVAPSRTLLVGDTAHLRAEITTRDGSRSSASVHSSIEGGPGRAIRQRETAFDVAGEAEGEVIVAARADGATTPGRVRLQFRASGTVPPPRRAESIVTPAPPDPGAPDRASSRRAEPR